MFTTLQFAVNTYSRKRSLAREHPGKHRRVAVFNKLAKSQKC
jgi:hypothetical protein